ncbi:helix-turn-helix transcriptional regulator [Cohnella sp. JJ-181]|uniref:helix-turn-helix transcriptional regulator n=1 Tax=Cohnella rhizoplanae TaxID=2974897 RepID=UPI0022FF6B13|nr:AraC family transcriptional regulator [Cohnella sp. JJ-181]CAI6083126.1 Arabinose operon regulatory protein [Cohnella sp. JJ-181]
MQNAYTFHYLEETAEPLFLLSSVGEGETADEEYRWHGLERTGGGMVFQYTVRGEGLLRIGGQTYAVPRHHAFLIGIPGDHEYRFDASRAETWSYRWIRFESKGMGGAWKEWMDRLGPVLELAPDAEPMLLLESLYADASTDRLKDRYEVSQRIYEWMASLQRYCAGRKQPSLAALPEPYRRVADYMDGHYAEDLTLDRLADVAGMTRTHVCKMFARNAGMTPIEYLRNRRMEKAAELLRQSGLPVKDIAARCGYPSVGYFGKVFLKVTGMQPTAFREAEEDKVHGFLRLIK